MFTNDEIDLINEGLDALKSKASSDMFSASLIGLILSSDKESGKKNVDDTMAEFDSEKGDRRLLEDRITLLRAKLIQLRDKRLVEEVASSI